MIENNVGLDLLNYQDDLNELIGFKILNTSNLNSEKKILLFKMINQNIDSLRINNFKSIDLSRGINNYPLIIHSMLVDELEITFILLNNLLKNGLIKKNTNNITETKVYDYYLLNTDININFIPIIFKYVKDNINKCNKFEEINSNYNIKILPNIKNSIITLLFTIKISIFFIVNKLNIEISFSEYENNFNNLNLNNNIINKVKKNNISSNKYFEITIDSNMNNNQLNTLTNTNLDTNLDTNLNTVSTTSTATTNIINNKNTILNKNIWMNNTANKKKSHTILTHEFDLKKKHKNNIFNSNNTSDSNNSNLSESDILFEYN